MVARITPSKDDFLINKDLESFDEELRFFHKILVLWERYGYALVTTRFDDRSISAFLKNRNISSPHDTKNKKIVIEDCKNDFIQFKGSGNVGRRLVKFIRNSYAHNIMERTESESSIGYLHLQTWGVSRRVNDGKPYCKFDLCLKFEDLRDLMEIILKKYWGKM